MAALTGVVVTRIGAILQRIDLPCANLGLPTPPASGDLKILHGGSGWTLMLSCSLRHADAFMGWLHALGAADVQRAFGREPVLLRARFHTLPGPCREILRECRVEHATVSADGTASVVVRGTDDAVARLAHTLGLGAGRAEDAQVPPLTPRQAELLQYCVTRGYYSIPRRASLRRLSSELGISTTSLSIALRRAEAKIILAHAARLRLAGFAPAQAKGLMASAAAEAPGAEPLPEGDLAPLPPSPPLVAPASRSPRLPPPSKV